MSAAEIAGLLAEHRGDEDHRLDLTVRPAACSCGHARFAGSPTFVRRRHAAHVREVRGGDR